MCHQAAGAAITARAVVLAPVGAVAAFVGAKAESVEGQRTIY